MRRWMALAIAVPLMGTGAPSLAQPQASPNTHPAPIIQGQSARPVAAAGGIEQAGVAAPAAASPPSSGPLRPGPPAGDERAAGLSNAELITGGVAITAAVVCALVCFSNSSSTTTSTTVTHR